MFLCHNTQVKLCVCVCVCIFIHIGNDFGFVTTEKHMLLSANLEDRTVQWKI